MPDVTLSRKAASLVAVCFDLYQAKFIEITQRAKERFEQCQWQEIQKDSRERLALYKSAVSETLDKLQEALGGDYHDLQVWLGAKSVYEELIKDRIDFELAESFFNSITRKVFTTKGVNESIEFFYPDHEPLPKKQSAPIYHTYLYNDDLRFLLLEILKDYPFESPYKKPAEQVRLVIKKIKASLVKRFGDARFDRIELLKPVFYRNKGAYIIGRIIKDEQTVPLCLVLLNPEEVGIVVDTILMRANDISVVFSFTRSYFLADIKNPAALMLFLKSIMPLKRRSELYNSIGFDKHGKTVLFRELMRHLKHSDEQFSIAPGIRGMVMTVFTMPSLNLVFKIIKDKFDPPKKMSRDFVKQQYKLVFTHDRVGRLADAQEFEYLVFKRRNFTEELLDELLRIAKLTVEVTEEEVVIKHVYIERKMIPLNLYLQQVEEKLAKEAIVEYGNAIKELAAANVFPGDLLIKNFGVTRHGRVVFYDYDEISMVTDCNFRRIPEPRDHYQEYSNETWYTVAENDIFPEELRRFIIKPGPLRDAFLDAHDDLFGVEFWHDMQERQQNGEILDVYPYRRKKRFKKILAE